MTTSPEPLTRTSHTYPTVQRYAATLQETSSPPPSQLAKSLRARLREVDHHLAAGNRGARTLAEPMLHQIRHECSCHNQPVIEMLALTRLIEQFGSTRSPHALQWLRDAEAVVTALPVQRSHAYTHQAELREVAHHALRLGQAATRFALNGHPALHLALRFYSFAVDSARASGDRPLLASAYFWLGNLLENLFLVRGRRRDLRGAWACYALAESASEIALAEDPGGRIRQRLFPRLNSDARSRIEREVQIAAPEIVEEAVARELDSPEGS